MKFSFDETEILNFYLENENIHKDILIKKLNDIKSNSDDINLIDLCNSINKKIFNMDEKQYNNLITELPVDIITIY
ncbi:hypothetical protein FDB61_15590 [Clostridium botulinum]|nr:hypothetical protein [Clostridium botulinum]